MATATVHEDDAQRLQKLHPDHQAAVLEDYAERQEKAGGAAKVPPEVQRRLMQQAIDKVADDEEAREIRRQRETGLHLDLVEPAQDMRIGKFPCRPFSAAVVVILEAIAHPVLEGDKNQEMTVADLMVLLFVFCCESERQLVQLSRRGAEAMAEEATLWAFGLGMAELEQMGAEAMDMIGRTASGDEPGNPRQSPAGTG